MTYNMSSRTLNPTIPSSYHTYLADALVEI